MKKAIPFILTIVIAVLFAGCQATPEEPIVVKKDTERMIEKAGEQPSGTAIRDLGVPQGHYEFNIAGADGRLKICADADVSLPNVETMPIMRASVASFTQEQVTGMFNYLFPDEKPVINSQIETKSSIEKEIVRMQNKISENDYGSLTPDKLQEIIKQLEEAYRNAPEAETEAQISDGTMSLAFDSQTREPLFWSLSAATSSAQFSVSVPADVSKIGFSTSGAFVSGASISYKRVDTDYSTRNMVSTDGATLPDDAQGKLRMKYTEAASLCEAFFTAAGVPATFAVGEAFIIDDSGADESKAENFAYLLIFTRTAEKSPLFFELNKTSNNQDEVFSLPWEYETIQIVVDNNGIVSVVWRNPIIVGDMVQQDSSLMAFCDIDGVFQTMMKTSYEAVVTTTLENQCELDICITDVRLCLMRVREQNAAQTDGLLVPAWVFYGHNKGTNSAGEVRYFQGASSLNSRSSDETIVNNFEFGSEQANNVFFSFPGVRELEPVVLMAINAIDGSVIDIQKGY